VNCGNSISDAEDTDLALKVQKRDEAAFRRLCDKHHPWISGKVLRSMRHTEDSEEVVADILFKVWCHAHNWDPKVGTFYSWLGIVARNTIIDAIRKRVRLKEVMQALAEEIESESAFIEHEVPLRENEILAHNMLMGAFKRVKNPNYRAAWTLHYLEGQSIHEVAIKLNCNPNTVKTWVFRCREALAAILTATDWS